MSKPFLTDMVCAKCHGRNYMVQAWVNNLTSIPDPEELPWSFYDNAADRAVQAYYCFDCEDDHGLTEAVPLRDLFPVICAAAGLAHDAEIVARRKAEWAHTATLEARRRPSDRGPVIFDGCPACSPGEPCSFHEGIL